MFDVDASESLSDGQKRRVAERLGHRVTAIAQDHRSQTRNRELALERFRTQMPVKLESADEDPWLNAVLVKAGDDGRAIAIEQLLLPASDAGRAT